MNVASGGSTETSKMFKVVYEKRSFWKPLLQTITKVTLKTFSSLPATYSILIMGIG